MGDFSLTVDIQTKPGRLVVHCRVCDIATEMPYDDTVGVALPFVLGMHEHAGMSLDAVPFSCPG